MVWLPPTCNSSFPFYVLLLILLSSKHSWMTTHVQVGCFLSGVLCLWVHISVHWKPQILKLSPLGCVVAKCPTLFFQASILSNLSISSTAKPPQLLPLPLLFSTYSFSLLSADFLRTHKVYMYLSILTLWPSKRKMEFFFEISADPDLGTGRRCQIRLCVIHCAGKVRTTQCTAAVEWGCQKAEEELPRGDGVGM